MLQRNNLVYSSVSDILSQKWAFNWDDYALTHWTNYVSCYIDGFTNHLCFSSINPMLSLGGNSFAIELIFLLFSWRLVYFAYDIKFFFIKINEYIYKLMRKDKWTDNTIEIPTERKMSQTSRSTGYCMSYSWSSQSAWQYRRLGCLLTTWEWQLHGSLKGMMKFSVVTKWDCQEKRKGFQLPASLRAETPA